MPAAGATFANAQSLSRIALDCRPRKGVTTYGPCD